MVILENSYRDSVSLSQEFLIHPVIKHIVKKGQFLNLNKKLLSCSGPYSTEIIIELIRQKMIKLRSINKYNSSNYTLTISLMIFLLFLIVASIFLGKTNLLMLLSEKI